MPNLLSKLNYMGTYFCASIVGFGRKVEKKKLTTKRKNGQLARLLIIQRALSPGSSFSNRTLVP